ncbi:MAG: alternate-type signal peptide domain-containing protein [Propionibacteriales bacterium]|nr:alternate-type signal peptide domain-containing protein [Propionibacteriales bacterium]
MKKTTKGALAAAAAGTLLVGGAGTLAFWTDAVTIGGTDVSSGHLKLVDASCAGWKIDGGANYTNQLLVPGDTLTRHCEYTLDAAGSHLTAKFNVDPGSGFTGDPELLAEASLTAAYDVDGTPVLANTPTPITDGQVVAVDLKIDWPLGSENNTSNDLGGFSAALADVNVTVTQGHSS